MSWKEKVREQVKNFLEDIESWDESDPFEALKDFNRVFDSISDTIEEVTN